MENLERRDLLTLIGVAPELPLIAYGAEATLQYEAASQSFDVDTVPLAMLAGASGPVRPIRGDANMEIHIQVDNGGDLVGGVAGDDLVIEGDIDLDGDSIIDVSGTLLTGEIAEFGHQEAGATDLYDFRFETTGGALATMFAGKDIGVTTGSEQSTFTGSFEVGFSGEAKGTVGAIDKVFEAGIDVEKYVMKFEQGCEGLTPGYWKQPHHCDDWSGFTPDQDYNQVFGVSDPDSPTLLEALQRGGGRHKALGRHSVAALLNAAHDNVEYAFTQTQIISMVQAAFATGDFNGVKGQFEAKNELGADLNDGGSGCGCGTGDFGSDADEPTGPIVPVGSTVKFTYTVSNTGDVELDNVTVIDDNQTPNDPSDDFSPTAIERDGFNIGDADKDGRLDPGETWLYTAYEQVTKCQHTNIATAVGTPVDAAGNQIGEEVSDSDPANYKGVESSCGDHHRHRKRCHKEKGHSGHGSCGHDDHGKRWHHKRDGNFGHGSRGNYGHGKGWGHRTSRGCRR